MIEKQEEKEIAFKAETGELYMLGKKERRLLRAVLGMTLRSKAGREAIIRVHGEEYIQLAETLLAEMGGFG
jgi:hypothetical protein